MPTLLGSRWKMPVSSPASRMRWSIRVGICRRKPGAWLGQCCRRSCPMTPRAQPPSQRMAGLSPTTALMPSWLSCVSIGSGGRQGSVPTTWLFSRSKIGAWPTPVLPNAAGSPNRKLPSRARYQKRRAPLRLGGRSSARVSGSAPPKKRGVTVSSATCKSNMLTSPSFLSPPPHPPGPESLRRGISLLRSYQLQVSMPGRRVMSSHFRS